MAVTNCATVGTGAHTLFANSIPYKFSGRRCTRLLLVDVVRALVTLNMLQALVALVSTSPCGRTRALIELVMRSSAERIRSCIVW